jgi:hypothetical protein
MPDNDDAAILEAALNEVDAFLRQRLDESQLKVPHLIIAATKEGQAVLRSNVDPYTLRSIGKDIIEIADEITRQPTEGDTTH